MAATRMSELRSQWPLNMRCEQCMYFRAHYQQRRSGNCEHPGKAIYGANGQAFTSPMTLRTAWCYGFIGRSDEEAHPVDIIKTMGEPLTAAQEASLRHGFDALVSSAIDGVSISWASNGGGENEHAAPGLVLEYYDEAPPGTVSTVEETDGSGKRGVRYFALDGAELLPPLVPGGLVRVSPNPRGHHVDCNCTFCLNDLAARARMASERQGSHRLDRALLATPASILGLDAYQYAPTFGAGLNVLPPMPGAGDPGGVYRDIVSSDEYPRQPPPTASHGMSESYRKVVDFGAARARRPIKPR
jgi:hypothetical protein